MNVDKIFDRAINILQHIKRTGPVGVFLVGGYFKTCRAGGELFNRAFDKKPQSLVGVYDIRCEEEWLIEDLQYMNNLHPNL